MKRLSIVTISFNDLKGLKKTVASLQCKGNRDRIEHLIIDGGSTDGTLDYLEENSQSFEYWHSKKDNGIYDAMNIGLGKANGEYIWFLNSGDELHSCESLQVILDNLGHNDILYGKTMYVDEKGNPLGLRGEITSRQLPKKLSYASMHNGMVVSHQSLIIRSELCLKYNKDLKYVADFDWLTRILKNGATTQNLGCVVSKFLTGGTSAKNQRASNKERFKVMVRHFGIFKTIWIHIKKGISPRTYKSGLN